MKSSSNSNEPSKTHYDYIIAGAGCAGSSLLKRMMSDVFFHNKSILVIDHSPKNNDDRTWCFWEKEDGVFEDIVAHQWSYAQFLSNTFSSKLTLSPYKYKMIRSADLYRTVRERSRSFPNIEWLQEAVVSVGNHGGKARVQLPSAGITSDYVFNSILFDYPVSKTDHYFLWQHFTGWFIQTAQPVFDPGLATLMDFTVEQNGGTSFMYVLPLSSRTALVEYTVFSENLLEAEVYERILKEHISSRLQAKEYVITHAENGKIPMTSMPFPMHKDRVINIGVAGGDIKPSSGYAFQFIQKRTEAIVASLQATGKPYTKKTAAKFRLYDNILLRVLQKKLMPGDALFAGIFQKNSPERILCFLDNESSLLQDLSIMRSVPSRVFLPAAFHELKKWL
jgi:lycopene beta-cyclase